MYACRASTAFNLVEVYSLLSNFCGTARLSAVAEDAVHSDLSASDDDGHDGNVLNALRYDHVGMNSVSRNDNIGDDQFSDAASDLSATSNLTTRTEHEIRALQERNVHMLPEELVELNDICSHILHDTVFQKGTEAQLVRLLDDLHIAGSGHGLRLERRTGALHQCTSSFEVGHSIRPLSVIKALLDAKSLHDLDAAPWRPDDILFKANLAHLARRVLHIDEDTGTKLQKLDCEWPRPFLSGLTTNQGKLKPGHSRLVDDTIDAALAIRSQLAVHLLCTQHGMPGMTPLDIVDRAFRLGVDRQSGGNNFCFERVNWTVPGSEAASEDILKRIATNARGCVDFLRSFISDEGESHSASVINFDGLNDAFPLRALQLTLIKWIRKRCQELNDSITAYGGAYAIRDALEQEIDARAKEQRVRSSLPKFAAGSNASMRLLAARRKRLSDKVRTPIPTALERDPLNVAVENTEFPGTSLFVPESEQPIPNEDQTDDDNRSSNEELDRSQQDRREKFETKARVFRVQVASGIEPKSKRQKLTDRQATATRIAPINESQESHDENVPVMVNDVIPNFSDQIMRQPLQRGKSSPGRTSSAVRQQPVALDVASPRRPADYATKATTPAQESDSEVDGYETDTRNPRPERRAHARSIAALSSVGISGHSALVDQSPRNTDTTRGPQSYSTTEVKNNVRHEQTPASQADGSQMAPPASDYSTVNEQAKSLRRAQDAKHPKVRKRRQPWEREETDALIDYIERLGTSWALIKAVDSGGQKDKMTDVPHYKALLERDQNSLKDKARNMKLDYLR